MIISFGDQETQNVFERIGSRKLPSLIQKTALRKLAMLHAATQLPDLLIPPGNKLERLRGDKKGRYAIDRLFGCCTCLFCFLANWKDCEETKKAGTASE